MKEARIIATDKTKNKWRGSTNTDEGVIFVAYIPKEMVDEHHHEFEFKVVVTIPPNMLKKKEQVE